MDRRLTRDMFPSGTDERVLMRGDYCDQNIIQDILGTFEDIDETENILQNKNAYSAFYIGAARLYHTFTRKEETDAYQYAGLCEYRDDKNLHPQAGRKVFIISQYHSEEPARVEFNRRFASAMAYNLVTEYGDVPIVPHLYFTQFMNDEGWERDFGIEAGHLMMRMCDSAMLATIDGRISEGMKADLEYLTVQLGIQPEKVNLTEAQASRYIEETEKRRYEEWNRAKHR